MHEGRGGGGKDGGVVAVVVRVHVRVRIAGGWDGVDVDMPDALSFSVVRPCPGAYTRPLLSLT